MLLSWQYDGWHTQGALFRVGTHEFLVTKCPEATHSLNAIIPPTAIEMDKEEELPKEWEQHPVVRRQFSEWYLKGKKDDAGKSAYFSHPCTPLCGKDLTTNAKILVLRCVGPPNSPVYQHEYHIAPELKVPEAVAPTICEGKVFVLFFHKCLNLCLVKWAFLEQDLFSFVLLHDSDVGFFFNPVARAGRCSRLPG
jgi:hypothetical protein